MAQASVQMNFWLGIFNLLPIPPLDGSKVVEAFLPIKAMRKFESISRYGFMILLVLMFTGALRILAYPVIFATNLTIYAMAALFNLGPLT